MVEKESKFLDCGFWVFPCIPSFWNTAGQSSTVPVSDSAERTMQSSHEVCVCGPWSSWFRPLSLFWEILWSNSKRSIRVWHRTQIEWNDWTCAAEISHWVSTGVPHFRDLETLSSVFHVYIYLSIYLCPSRYYLGKIADTKRLCLMCLTSFHQSNANKYLIV